MRVAFKEWAVVVEALGSGQQIVILRKGGISEGRRGFQVEHSEFVLYPTLFHQQRASVTDASQESFDRLGFGGQDPLRVRLEFFATVVSWRRLDSLTVAERLRGQHIWRDEVIASRFDWGPGQNIHILAVRVFRLAEPMELPVLPIYTGCKSWIELEQEVATDGATPVLSKDAFNEKLDEFHAALDEESPVDESPKPI